MSISHIRDPMDSKTLKLDQACTGLSHFYTQESVPQSYKY